MEAGKLPQIFSSFELAETDSAIQLIIVVWPTILVHRWIKFEGW
jgi:hypothetical protein